MPLPQCIYGASKEVTDQNAYNKLIQLLTGLNESYDSVCSQILMLDPLPNVNKAYSMVLHVEKQSEIKVGITDTGHNVEMMVHGQNYKQMNKFATDLQHDGKQSVKSDFTKVDKSKLHCSYCNFTGHIRETYFKLHGVPYWYKNLAEAKKRTGVKNVANMAEGTTDPYDSKDASLPSDLTNKIQSLIQNKVTRFIKGKNLAEVNTVNMAHLANFAGTSIHNFTFATLSLLEVGSWIIDTGATNQKCFDRKFFKTFKPLNTIT